MKNNTVSRATLGRLPMYLKYLERKDCKYISSVTISEELDLGEVQVRKDLNAVCGKGKPRIGYITSELIESIKEHLGKDHLVNAALIGVGKIGMALLEYNGFEEFGVKIAASFENDNSKINIERKIYSISDFSKVCKENDIKIAIIAVGVKAAQQVCDMIVENGIKAIWNFAPCKLYMPDDIIFIQENLALSLAHLKNKLSL